MRNDIHVTVEHTFVERCSVLTRIVASYSAWSIIWVLIGVVQGLNTLVYQKTNALYLQKTLVALPFIKAAETLVYSMYFKSCPWVNIQTDLTLRYIDMARVSIVTFTYTVLLAYFFLISKGW